MTVTSSSYPSQSPTLPAAPDPVPQQQPPVSDSANPVAKEDPSETVPASLPSPDPCDIISTGNELKVAENVPATGEPKQHSNTFLPPPMMYYPPIHFFDEKLCGRVVVYLVSAHPLIPSM